MLSIYKMTQKELFKFLKGYLKKHYRKVIVKDKYIYAEGVIPVLLVSHTDTVHSKPPTYIYNKSGKLSAKEGLGADDRAGVTAMLQIISLGYCPHVLFCADEEIGGVGAKVASRELNPDVNILIEFDRRGSNDYVTYSCDNPDMDKWVEKFGFEKEHGSFSDISTLAPAWKVGAVNLSIGYYNAHRKDEYLVLKEWKDIVNRACSMLEDYPKEKFEYIPKKYDSLYNYSPLGYDDTIIFELFADELEAYDQDIDWMYAINSEYSEIEYIARKGAIDAIIRNKHKFKTKIWEWDNVGRGL